MGEMVMVDIEFRRFSGELRYRKLMHPTGLPLSAARWTEWREIADEALAVVAGR